jgi:hypothetical protein
VRLDLTAEAAGLLLHKSAVVLGCARLGIRSALVVALVVVLQLPLLVEVSPLLVRALEGPGSL